MTQEQFEQVCYLLDRGYQIIISMDKVTFELSCDATSKKLRSFLIKGNGSLVNSRTVPSNSVFIFSTLRNLTKRVFNQYGECLVLYGPVFPNSEIPILLYNDSSHPHLNVFVKPGQLVMVKETPDKEDPGYIDWDAIMGGVKGLMLNSLHFITWVGTKGNLEKRLIEKGIESQELLDGTLGEDELVFLIGLGDQEIIAPLDTHADYGIYIVSQI